MVHNRVKEIRKKKFRKFTQSELAEKAGVSRGTILNLERGKLTSPQYETMVKVASALECKVNEVFVIT